jgi:hypothetical protein
MPDPYLAIAAIAQDQYMNQRMQACVTQEAYQGHIPLGVNDAPQWVTANAYVWASSPSWGAKWASALALHESEPEYEPGKDEAVITDGDILSTVQALIPSLSEREQAAAEPPEDQRVSDTADQVAEENAAAPG